MERGPQGHCEDVTPTAPAPRFPCPPFPPQGSSFPTNLCGVLADSWCVCFSQKDWLLRTEWAREGRIMLEPGCRTVPGTQQALSKTGEMLKEGWTEGRYRRKDGRKAGKKD